MANEFKLVSLLNNQLVLTAGPVISAGTQSQNTGTVVFSNSNGVSFGLNNGTLTASAVGGTGGGGGVAISAGTNSTSTGTVQFANSNGITFGMNTTGIITASHNALTTAMASDAGSNFMSTSERNNYFFTSNNTFANSTHSHGNLALTNINGTSASSGLSLSVPNASAYVFSNSNGVSFGTNGSTVTATVKTDYLTTAMVSDASTGFMLTGERNNYFFTSNNTFANSTHSHGNIAFSGTNVSASFTSASNGLSIQLSGGAGAAGNTGYLSAGTTNASLGTVSFANSNGVSFGIDGQTITATVKTDYLTTAAQSGHTHGAPSITGSINITSNSNAWSISIPAFLTTARASNDAVGLNTALTAGPLALTINSNGLSLNAGSAAGTTSGFAGNLISGSMTHNTAGLNLSLNHPAWLTTAANSTHSHGNPTLALTNLSGTTASASNGFTLSLSAAAPGGGGVTPVASASNGSFSFTTLGFSNANNVTFGTSAGSIITASVAAPGAAAEQNAINLLGANTAGSTTATGSTIGWSGVNLTLSGTNSSQVIISAPATSSIVGVGNVSLSSNGSTISIIGQGGTATMWQPFNEGVNVAGQHGQATMHIVPLPTPTPAALGELYVDRLCVPIYFTNSTNAGSVTLSYWFGLYTKTGSTLSRAASTSYSTNWTFSSTNSGSVQQGIRLHTIPWTTTIGDGRYYVGQISRSTTGGNNATLSQMLVSQLNSNFSGVFGQASNRSNQWPAGYGVLSASTTALPASIAFSQIDGTASLAARPPSFFMINGTV